MLILIVIIFIMMVVLMLILIMMVVMLVFIFVLVLFFLMLVNAGHNLLHHLFLHVILLRNDGKKLLSCELILRCRDDRSIRVDGTDDGYGFIDLVRCRNISSRKNDGTGILNLIVEELTEVL